MLPGCIECPSSSVLLLKIWLWIKAFQPLLIQPQQHQDPVRQSTVSCAVGGCRCKCMRLAWSFGIDILKLTRLKQCTYFSHLYSSLLTVYYRCQTCDHTNKIIKRSEKGKCIPGPMPLKLPKFGKVHCATQWGLGVQQHKRREVWHQVEELLTVSWSKHHKPPGDRGALRFIRKLYSTGSHTVRSGRNFQELSLSSFYRLDYRKLWSKSGSLQNHTSGDTAGLHVVIATCLL